MATIPQSQTKPQAPRCILIGKRTVVDGTIYTLTVWHESARGQAYDAWRQAYEDDQLEEEDIDLPEPIERATGDQVDQLVGRVEALDEA